MRQTRLLRVWESRFSLHRARCLRFTGPMRATSKPRSALDEEDGPSDRDLFNLMDQALCLGTRVVFPKVSAELYTAGRWRVPCARRWKRPERITKLECEAVLWTFRAICRKSPIARKSTLDPVRQYVMGMRVHQRSVINFGSVARRACELCGLCFDSNASVRSRWFPSERNEADEPSRGLGWSSQYHALFRESSNSRLPRRCFFLESSTHRVLAATLCNESKREKNLRAILRPAAAEGAQEQQRAGNGAVKASALPPRFALMSAGDPRLR